MSRPRLAPALPVALALSLAGCSEPPAPTPVTLSPDAGRTVAVGQNGMPRFVTPGAAAGEENQVTIMAGATVTWRFATSGYNVVSGGGTPDAGCVADGVFCSPNDQNCAGAVPPQAAGSFYQRTFQDAGAYPYFSQPGCLQGMTGVVQVTPPDGGLDGGVDGGG
jgi:plastocyanin